MKLVSKIVAFLEVNCNSNYFINVQIYLEIAYLNTKHQDFKASVLWLYVYSTSNRFPNDSYYSSYNLSH